MSHERTELEEGKEYFRAKRIIVASASEIKLSPVRQAFEEKFGKKRHDIVGVQADSGVSNQPIGLAETYMGAFNRLQKASASTQAANAYGIIAIESGIVDMYPQGKGVWTDQAIILAKFDGKIFREDTVALEIPWWCVDEVFLSGKKKTWGEIIYEDAINRGLDPTIINPQDPHSIFTKGVMPRSLQLKMGLAKVLDNLPK